MDEFRIKQYAPEIAIHSPHRVKKVEKYLKKVIGVPEECSLKDVKVEYLIKDDLLRLSPAKNLVAGWQKG